MRERFGVYPKQFIDFRALTGDSSDNIPGVPGIGEKTAAKLLQQYPSLNDILYHLNELPKRQQEKIQQHRKQALLSKQLVTIEQNAPIEVDLNKCAYNSPDYPRLLKLFTELEFKSLVKSLIASNHTGIQEETNDIKPVDTYRVKYQKITTPEQLQELISTVRNVGKISLVLDGNKETGVITAVIATRHPAPAINQQVSLQDIPQATGDKYQVFYLPVEEKSPEHITLLTNICEDELISKICHDC